mmetsp:Transcript_52323/g.136238  ORF Transcript_52323/g.136238 Transcript_52323/m.136238 type:complete len:263 (+) Transcript_52323:1079-1867(+)
MSENHRHARGEPLADRVWVDQDGRALPGPRLPEPEAVDGRLRGAHQHVRLHAVDLALELRHQLPGKRGCWLDRREPCAPVHLEACLLHHRAVCHLIEAAGVQQEDAYAAALPLHGGVGARHWGLHRRGAVEVVPEAGEADPLSAAAHCLEEAVHGIEGVLVAAHQAAVHASQDEACHLWALPHCVDKLQLGDGSGALGVDEAEEALQHAGRPRRLLLRSPAKVGHQIGLLNARLPARDGHEDGVQVVEGGLVPQQGAAVHTG